MPMMAGPRVVMMLMMMLLNGGGRDLLDCISTADYWNAKHVTVSVENMTLELAGGDQKVGDISALVKDLGSDDYATREAATKKLRAMGPGVIPQLKEIGLTATDSEAADRSRQIIESFTVGSKTKEIRRLMAIRALGELKKPEGAAVLKPLLDSKDPFIAEYAQAALASIAGKPFQRPLATAAQLRADLNMLPPGLGAVAQQKLDCQDVGLIETIIDQTTAASPADTEETKARAKENKARMLDMATSEIIGLAEQLGNVRIDSMTLGVSKEITSNTGFVVLIAHGQYDSAALARLLEKQAPATKIKDVPVYGERQVAIMLPSNQSVIFVGGPNRDAMPLEAMAATIATPKDRFDQDPDLVKLVADADTTKTIWAALKVSDSYRQASIFMPFTSMQAVAERKDGTLQFSVTAKGTDATAVKAQVDDFNKELADAQKNLQQMQANVPQLKGVLDFLGTIKCQATGADATLTGSVKDLAITGAVLSSLPMHTAERHSTAVQVVPQIAPAPPPGP